MKFLAFLLALLMFGCGCEPTSAPMPAVAPSYVPAPAAVIEDIRNTTVAIVNDEGRLFCAGVWLSDSTVLTAAHCVDDNAPSFIALYPQYDVAKGPGQKAIGHLAFPQKIDRVQDLALLVTFPVLFPHGVASFAPDAPKVADEVYIVGHPGTVPFVFTKGTLDGVRFMSVSSDAGKIEGWFVGVWNSTAGGNSGGGMWDRQGRLIGICSFGLTRAPLDYFIAPEAIRAFLN